MNTDLLNFTWDEATQKNNKWEAMIDYANAYKNAFLAEPYAEHREERFTINTSMDEINLYRRSAIDFAEYTKSRILDRCVRCRLIILQISLDWQFGFARISVTGELRADMNETALRIYNIDKLRNFQII